MDDDAAESGAKDRAAVGESPDVVQCSTAAAMTLGLIKGRSMFVKGKRYFLFTFAGNFPFSWLVEDFAFFWFSYRRTRDQMMGRHRANHIIVAYAPSAEMADKALAAKAAMLSQMGISVHLCGL